VHKQTKCSVFAAKTVLQYKRQSRIMQKGNEKVRFGTRY